MRFPVVLHTDDGVRYGVTVPDLPGCFSAGDSMDEALDSVVEAIDAHVYLSIEDGHGLPAIKPISAHKDHDDFLDGVWAFVDVQVERYLE